MITDLPADEPTPSAGPRRRPPNWRLRALLAISALSLGLYVFVRLDRSVAEPFGPVIVGVHDLFNQVPGKALPLTSAAKRLKADVEAMGGDAGVNVTEPGYFGTIGQEEWFNVTFHNPEFGDADLAKLAEAHGTKIGGLYLDNTGVTDAGLKSLGKFTMLRHLHVRNYAVRKGKGIAISPPKVTDAGMSHLKGLDHLWTLNLSGLPITDDGLGGIMGLPELMGLYLSSTNVEGRSLSRLKSLPRLSILYLDKSKMTEEGLKALSGATSLQYLSLSGVHLTPEASPLLKALPRVDRMELTGCGFLDEEIADLVKSKPGLKIIRQ